MTTSLEGVPQPTLKIIKDGKDVTTNEQLSVEFEDEKIKLCIKNTTLDNSGIYKIEATNEVGSDSVECSLNIIGKILHCSNYCMFQKIEWMLT